MRVSLARRVEDDATVTLAANVTLPPGPLQLRYATRTGALLRIDGVVRGAFDGKHRTIALPDCSGAHELVLQVERRSMPIADLPAGDGFVWRLMLARASQQPALEIEVEARAPSDPDARVSEQLAATRVALVGHAHLDVAWLWTYDDSKRKALRTFATALREMDLEPRYVFTQSMPQLYAWVQAADPELFARVRERASARDGWDASTATMWVEPDLHAPSGESVLRQFAHGMRWTREHLGVEPTVCWLPDTFGFPSTLPQLATHAGVTSFVTTKLQWNEKTRWPYPRFLWEGDDGSVLPSAVVGAYEGEISEKRIAAAAARGNELLLHGYGDGGGGPTDEQLASVAPELHPWRAVDAFYGACDADVPRYHGELYLETHRGTYTTHHAIKARSAALERQLAAAEELAAWCVAVRAPRSVVSALGDDLRNAWRIVLRAQFHDVMAGTSLPAVYADVHAEFDRAQGAALRVADAAQSVLPRSDLRRVAAPALEPRYDGETWTFANDYLRARVRADGTIVELATADGPNLVTIANGLAAYVDRPKRYDAWNVDRSYVNRRLRVRRDGAEIVDGALVVRLRIGKKSRATMRVALNADEPWLRVELAVAWYETHVLLRTEHRLAVRAQAIRYGQPHGTLLRTAYPADAAEAQKFEVPAQRFAHVDDGSNGFAVLAADLYGWNGVGLKDGGVRLGTSLLRSPAWPDPTADRGEQHLAYAFAPTAGATVAALENAWSAYAEEPRVRLFTCEDDAVLVVATYPADDGSGVIVRVRECDGAPREVALRSGGRVREALAVDATERPLAHGVVQVVEEELRFPLGAFALRSFLVRF